MRARQVVLELHPGIWAYSSQPDEDPGDFFSGRSARNSAPGMSQSTNQSRLAEPVIDSYAKSREW